VTWARRITAAFRATLERPGWWAIALAGFLARGGIVVLALPILALPTVAGFSTVVAPFISGLALGGASTAALVVVAVAAVAVTLLLILGGVTGAWLDVALFRDVLAGSAAKPDAPRTLSLRDSFSARLSAHLLTALALGFAAIRTVGTTYDELVAPTDPAAPLIFRVAERTPEAVAALVIAWAIAEAAGGLAVREHAAGGPSRSPGSAVLGGLRGLLRPTALATLVVTDLALAVVATATWIAAAGTWGRLADLFADGAGAIQLGIALVGFVVAWAAGLLILSVAIAWRAAAWTGEWASRRSVAPARDVAPPG
jgi:hypothetical protein